MDVQRRDQFLVSEMEHAGSALLQNEDMGADRLNLLLGLTAGTVAIGVAVYEVGGEGKSTPLVLVIIPVLLVFGWQTLDRIRRRNEETDRLKIKLARIRSFLMSEGFSPELLAYPTPPKLRSKKMKRSGGGLVEQAMLLNAVLVATFIALLAFSVVKVPTVLGIVALVTAAIVYEIQFQRTKKRCECYELSFATDLAEIERNTSNNE